MWKIKVKPVNVKLSIYIDFNVEKNDKDHKFEVGERVKIPKYKKIFWQRLNSKLVSRRFVMKKVRNWRINFGMYFEKELQKIDQTEFRIEKVIERKVDKLFVKWKGCDNLFNSWID